MTGVQTQQYQILIAQNRFDPSTAPTVGAVCVRWEENR